MPHLLTLEVAGRQPSQPHTVSSRGASSLTNWAIWAGQDFLGCSEVCGCGTRHECFNWLLEYGVITWHIEAEEDPLSLQPGTIPLTPPARGALYCAYTSNCRRHFCTRSSRNFPRQQTLVVVLLDPTSNYLHPSIIKKQTCTISTVLFWIEEVK